MFAVPLSSAPPVVSFPPVFLSAPFLSSSHYSFSFYSGFSVCCGSGCSLRCISLASFFVSCSDACSGLSNSGFSDTACCGPCGCSGFLVLHVFGGCCGSLLYSLRLRALPLSFRLRIFPLRFLSLQLRFFLLCSASWFVQFLPALTAADAHLAPVFLTGHSIFPLCLLILRGLRRVGPLCSLSFLSLFVHLCGLPSRLLWLFRGCGFGFLFPHSSSVLSHVLGSSLLSLCGVFGFFCCLFFLLPAFLGPSP